jgi:hypothetical protein
VLAFRLIIFNQFVFLLHSFIIVFQTLQCLFGSFSESLESGMTSELFNRCSSRDQRFNSSSEDVTSGVFQAIGQLTTSIGSNRLVSGFFQSILNFAGFRDFLSRSAKTFPAFPSEVTNELGFASIQFQFLSGRSGLYAVFFNSENAIGLSTRLLYFNNSVTSVSISDPRVLQSADETLNSRRRVFLPSFERETTLVARVNTHANADIVNVPLFATL